MRHHFVTRCRIVWPPHGKRVSRARSGQASKPSCASNRAEPASQGFGIRRRHRVHATPGTRVPSLPAFALCAYFFGTATVMLRNNKPARVIALNIDGPVSLRPHSMRRP